MLWLWIVGYLLIGLAVTFFVVRSGVDDQTPARSILIWPVFLCMFFCLLIEVGWEQLNKLLLKLFKRG